MYDRKYAYYRAIRNLVIRAQKQKEEKVDDKKEKAQARKL